MTKLIHRSKITYGLFVLAVLALSSGAGVKWGTDRSDVTSRRRALTGQDGHWPRFLLCDGRATGR